jgi:hypothetical protein
MSRIGGRVSEEQPGQVDEVLDVEVLDVRVTHRVV